VFTYAGNPVRYVNTKGWRNALKRAGIANFRWHDLTWASWLVQNGTPLYDLQEMGGAGSRPRWCGATHIWRLHRWRVTLQRSMYQCTSQIRHNKRGLLRTQKRRHDHS
jgi:hypothetical protein